MSHIQILFAKSDSVLGLGVVSVLQAEKDFLLVECQIKPNGAFVLDPEYLEPDVIILEVGKKTSARSQIRQTLRHYPKTALIMIQSAENRVKFLYNHETNIKEPEQLVAAIRATKPRKESE